MIATQRARRMMRITIYTIAVLGLVSATSLILALGGGARAQAQDSYQIPPAPILKVLNAPVTPQASVGRARDLVLLYSPVLYPSIADLAQPFARLAGLRIDVATNGPHNAPRFNNLLLKRVADGHEQKDRKSVV